MRRHESSRAGLRAHRQDAAASARWRLQDAQVQFSGFVRRAREKRPQRVTVHGKDAVVIVDADEWDRLKKPVPGRDLVETLANSPLRDMPIERVPVTSRARDVTL